MPAEPRFAALHKRLNRAVGVHLSNAMAVVGNGDAFPVEFTRSTAPDPFGTGAVDSPAHTLEFDADMAPGLAQGHTVEVDGVPYEVSSGVQPDQSGWLIVSVFPKT